MAKEETKKKSKKITTKNTKDSVKESPKVTSKTSKKTKNSTKTAKQPTIVQEQNNYGRTIIAAILIILVLVCAYFGMNWKNNQNKTADSYVATEDEKAFKDEYESINDQTRASTNQPNKNISILEKNNITYITMSEAASILENGSGVIYFGFAACPYSRIAVPILLSAMQSSDLDKIYYVNLRPDDNAQNDLRDTYTLNAKNKAKRTKEATSGYYDVLTLLANELSDYTLTTDSGKIVNTGEKRLESPTVVAVKNGEIVGFHEKTVTGHTLDENGALRDLTSEEESELLNTYAKIISNYLSK